jgi:hypothetical protein
VKPVKWDTFHEGDEGNEATFPLVEISSVAHGECMVNRQVQSMNVRLNFSNVSSIYREFGHESFTNVRRKTLIVLNKEVRECSVDMRADFLTSLGSSKDPDDRNFRNIIVLPRSLECE